MVRAHYICALYDILIVNILLILFPSWNRVNSPDRVIKSTNKYTAHPDGRCIYSKFLQFDDETRTLAGCAFCPYFPPVRLHQAAHDRQAQPTAHASGIAPAEKTLENVR
jgi:hypothetical protein